MFFVVEFLLFFLFCLFPFFLLSFFFFWHRTEKPVTLPPNHVVEHQIVRTDLGKSAKGFTVKLEEHAAAHVNPLKVQ